MRRVNGLLLLLSLFATESLASTGCKSRESEGLERIPPTTQIVTERPLPRVVEPTLITSGTLPLVYISEAEAVLRFTDLSADVEIVRARVPARQLVRIDARRGILIGESVLHPGPLNPDHRYGVWLSPGNEDYIRQTTIKPESLDGQGANPRRNP